MSLRLETDHRKVPIFDEMTSPDIAAAVAANMPVIVPLGAMEQHGAHLPLSTDTYQGLDMCRRAAALLAKEGIPLIVGPAIPFGPPPFLSESPQALPGTINISNDTLRALLHDVCSSLIGHGFRRIYLLLANVESEYAMHIVAKELTETTQANIVTLNWLIGIRPRYKGMMVSDKPQGHGGEGETARMLATAPHLVRMEEARPYHPNLPVEPEVYGDFLPYLGGAIGRYRFDRGEFRGMVDGITGDPQLATVETGEKSYALVADWVASAIRFDQRP
ncbi:creatininase family protein [Bosea sp. AAP35]|uniref:creatininase family protein n=1 Tax=Bosea sp. AAP35 TaxID=1523417 RepID=UPI0006B91B10|nr:creatininase family protein [Bosea sp. AAP35]